MSRLSRHWVLLTLFCSLSNAQLTAVIEPFGEAPWCFDQEIPVYQLPLRIKAQSYQIANQGQKLATGRKRKYSSGQENENQPLDRWIEDQIGKQGVIKKRKQSGRLLIFANQVLHGRNWCSNCVVIVENGYINSVKSAASVRYRSGDIIHVYPTATLSPGFIDVLTHGADGHDVMHGTVESLYSIASKLVEEGTTAFLPSSMTASRDDMMHVARIIAESMKFQPPKQAKILGWHAEGPYFSSEKIGCHDPKCRRNPDIDEVSQWQKASGNSLKVITIAPELPNALPFTRWASNNNILVSIGHTMASCAETNAAIDNGAFMATHLFNAMNNGSHQLAGCSAAIKTHPAAIYFTLIVDGLHIDPVNIRDLAARMDFTSRAILVTDGIMAKYQKDGHYTFGGLRIVVKGKEARLEDKGNLAGSILKMNEAVANLLTFAPDIRPEDALLMASYNPAMAIRAFGKGLVSEGYDADITLLDDQYNVLATYRAGQLAQQQSSLKDFYEYAID